MGRNLASSTALSGGNGKGSQIDRSFALMASLAEREVELFDDMDAADIRQIDAWLNEILGE